MAAVFKVEEIRTRKTVNINLNCIRNASHFFGLIINDRTHKLLGIELAVVFSPKIYICFDDVLDLLTAFLR